MKLTDWISGRDVTCRRLSDRSSQFRASVDKPTADKRVLNLRIQREPGYPIPVYQASNPHNPQILKSRHFIVLAWLLFVTQIFSQLHGIEHLDDAAHDGEVCQLCILSSGLDTCSVATFELPEGWLQTPRPAYSLIDHPFPNPAAAYWSRAPPKVSSIA